MLKEIPGITPARMYDGCTRNAYHLYMFRYDKTALCRLPRSVFLKALAAEGVPAAGGYTPLNKQAFLKNAFTRAATRGLFRKKTLASGKSVTAARLTTGLCEEAVWFTQTCCSRRAVPWSRLPEQSARFRRTQEILPGEVSVKMLTCPQDCAANGLKLPSDWSPRGSGPWRAVLWGRLSAECSAACLEA